MTKLSAVASSGVVLAAMVYLAVTGLSIVAGAVAQGFGYGAAFGLTGVVAALALALWLRALLDGVYPPDITRLVLALGWAMIPIAA